MESKKAVEIKKVFTPKKISEEKKLRFPRYHNDSLRNIIQDLKCENALLRKKLETYEAMYKKLEREYLDYKNALFSVREMDILGDEYFKDKSSSEEIIN